MFGWKCKLHGKNAPDQIIRKTVRLYTKLSDWVQELMRIIPIVEYKSSMACTTMP